MVRIDTGGLEDTKKYVLELYSKNEYFYFIGFGSSGNLSFLNYVLSKALTGTGNEVSYNNGSKFYQSIIFPTSKELNNEYKIIFDDIFRYTSMTFISRYDFTIIKKVVDISSDS